MKKMVLSLFLVLSLLIPAFPPAAADDIPVGTDGGVNGGNEFIITAAVTAGTVVNPPVINLASDTINLNGFTVQAFSLDGGTRWRRGTLRADRFSRMLNKELTLHLTDKFDPKAKQPASDANTVTFPKINARPRANTDKLRPFYSNERMIAGNENSPRRWDRWVLAKGSDPAGTSVYENLEFIRTTDRRLPQVPDWAPVEADGFEILPQSSSVRPTFFFTTAPVNANGVIIPRSAVFRISPANLGRETNHRINYRRENMRMRPGEFWSTDDGQTWTEVTAEETSLPNISEVITFGELLMIRRGATGRRPRTEDREIKPWQRLRLENVPGPTAENPEAAGLARTKGRITANMRAYEVQNPTDAAKWGNTPRFNATGDHPIRLRTTGKDASGRAGSAVGTLHITFGDFEDRGKTRQGVTMATITAPILPLITGHSHTSDTADTPIAVPAVFEESGTDLSITADNATGGFRWYTAKNADKDGMRRILNANAATFDTSTLNLAPGIYYIFARALNAHGYDESRVFVVTVKETLEAFRGSNPEAVWVPRPEFGKAVQTGPASINTDYVSIEGAASWQWSGLTPPTTYTMTGDFTLTVTVSSKLNFTFGDFGITGSTVFKDVFTPLFPGNSNITGVLSVNALVLTVTYADLRQVIPDLSALNLDKPPTIANSNNSFDPYYFFSVKAPSVNALPQFRLVNENDWLDEFWFETATGGYSATMDLFANPGFKFDITLKTTYEETLTQDISATISISVGSIRLELEYNPPS
jgi:hypothetical protein